MLDLFRVDHLFILVGENPLPCLVAGRLLHNPKGKIHMVYSVPATGENKYAIGLCDVLGVQRKDAVPLKHERHAESVYNEVSERVRSIGTSATIGLHYTGGTKVMAVHAYRAVMDVRPDAVCSYLDPNRLEMCIEQSGQLVKTEKLLAASISHQIGVTLNDLWKIHGLEPMQPGDSDYCERDAPAFERVPRIIGAHVAQGKLKELHGKVKRDKETGASSLADSEPIETLPFDDIAQAIRDERSDIQTVGDLRHYLGERHDNWLAGGDWLEDMVLGALKDLASELNFNDREIVCSTVIKRPSGKKGRYFEIDVVALRGYQLFAFSCTISENPETCKLKLFEVARRATQLGGSEARYALVCCHNNGDQLKQQIGDTLSPSTFAVFDRHTLVDLDGALRRWILSVDREAQ